MIQLQHFVRQTTHGSRLRRRRDRRLGAIRPSRPNMVQYGAALVVHVVDRLRADGREVVEALRPHWPMAHDAAPRTVRSEVGRVRAQTEPKIRAAAPALAGRAVQANVSSVDTKLAARVNTSLGIQLRQALLYDQSGIAETMSDSLRENVDLITSIPSDYFDELEEVLGENWVENGDWRDAVEAVEDLGDVTESRAELIARDQTAKMNSRFNEARQTSMDVERYEWVTAGDDRVRPAHEELEGTEHDWDDPPTDSDGFTGHPGDCGINCRCAADPILDVDAEPDDEDVSEEDLADEEDSEE